MFAKPQAIITSATLAVLLTACGGAASVRNADGTLSSCDSSANCLASNASDPDRQIEPLHYTGSREAAQRAMAKIVGQLRGGAVMENEPGYMRIEFTSQIFQFVDDVQLLFQSDRTIQVRTASRSEHFDFGESRQRIEKIRSAFDAIQP